MTSSQQTSIEGASSTPNYESDHSGRLAPASASNCDLTPAPRTIEEVVLSFGVTASESESTEDNGDTRVRYTTLTTPKINLPPHPTATRHSKIRKIAEEIFLKSANRQQKNFDRKKGGMASDYCAEDIVGVRVPKIDRTNTSMKLMPCKVLGKSNNRFRLYSPSGILSTTFAHTDLIDMRNRDFQQLRDIDPTKLEKVAFTKAARDNSGFKRNPNDVDGRTMCNCKAGKCNTNRCSCYKAKLTCSTKCHTDRQCLNRN